MRLFALLVFFSLPLWAQNPPAIDTVSIKGSVTLKEENYVLNGDFIYILQNTSGTPQSSWSLVANPLVNILSVRLNEKDTEILSQQMGAYRILTVTLPTPLKPGERLAITLRFSLLPQQDDPRFYLGPRGVFLDARRLWFPLPVNDLSISYELAVASPSNLNAVMSGRLVSDTSGLAGNYSRWESELDNISLSGTLIINNFPRYRQGSVYLYGNEQNLHLQPFMAYWAALKESTPGFPLSELHILPIDINIPGKGDDFADGEFLGNILLIDNKLVQAALQKPEGDFAWAGNAQKRLTETLIHELFHAYLPGILPYQAEEAIFMEGFVQYLTMNLISSQNPGWSADITRRNRFLMLNFLSARDTATPLWTYLLSTSLFAACFEESSLNGLHLINTLVEKYRYTQFVLADILETAEIHQTLSATNDTIYPEFLGEFHRTFLYNTALQVFSTNLGWEKASIVRIRHTFSKDWRGVLSWVLEGRTDTNSMELSIASGQTWISNIKGTISHASIKAPTDNLEQYLGDNIYSPRDYGKQLITFLNEDSFFNPTARLTQKIDVSASALETLNTYRSLNFSYLWDNSLSNEVQAYLVDSKNIRKAFISFIIAKKNGGYEITRIVNPLEKRILDEAINKNKIFQNETKQ